MAENKVLFPLLIGVLSPQLSLDPTWRIIPVRKYLVTPVYKPFSSPFGRGIIPFWEDLRTMVINHLHTSRDDPPSMSFRIQDFTFFFAYIFLPRFFLDPKGPPFTIWHRLVFSQPTLRCFQKSSCPTKSPRAIGPIAIPRKKSRTLEGGKNGERKNGRVLTWEDRMIRHVFGVICSSSCYIWFTS